MNADAASHALEKEIPGIRDRSNDLMKGLIVELISVGAPSWGQDTNIITRWPKTVVDAYPFQNKSYQPNETRLVFAHAKLSMLRASYLTVMLRAAGSVGPGLEEDTELVTGLAYMA